MAENDTLVGYIVGESSPQGFYFVTTMFYARNVKEVSRFWDIPPDGRSRLDSQQSGRGHSCGDVGATGLRG